MRITSIEIYKANIDLKERFKIAIMEVSTVQSIFIKINTDEGLYGLGEANPSRVVTGEPQATCLATAPDLAKLLIGQNPLEVENREKNLSSFLARNNAVRSAFDMALYDILGKASGLPLYQIFGGDNRSIETDMTLFIAAPGEMAEKAAELKNLGFKALKIKVGTTTDLDVRRVSEIRKAVGDEVSIRVELWTVETSIMAITTLRLLEPMRIEYCEQPVAHWDWQGMKRIRQNIKIPIMADESLFDHHDAFRLAFHECCDYFNIKLSKSGGLHTAMKIDAVAEGAGITCMMGCRNETRLGLSAAAHLVASRPNILFTDLDGHVYPTSII